jgi:cyclopropane fatty-acyl-phospholipid synthase-like methyltransferase
VLDSPAARRNREPILAALRPRLDAGAAVLEIASGSGQHAAFFAAELPGVTWQPTDRDGANFDSIVGWAREHGARNVCAPLELDVTDEAWVVGSFDAIFNANMVHISPWQTCLGLFRGAGCHLRSGGRLFLYGPFRVDGGHTAPSNAAFDADLRRRDPSWGVRDREAVEEVAAAQGFVFAEPVKMPANNQLLVFERS